MNLEFYHFYTHGSEKGPGELANWLVDAAETKSPPKGSLCINASSPR